MLVFFFFGNSLHINLIFLVFTKSQTQKLNTKPSEEKKTVWSGTEDYVKFDLEANSAFENSQTLKNWASSKKSIDFLIFDPPFGLNKSNWDKPNDVWTLKDWNTIFSNLQKDQILSKIRFILIWTYNSSGANSMLTNLLKSLSNEILAGFTPSFGYFYNIE